MAKTPYDTAIRVQQRDVDDVRLAINIQVHQLTQVETSRQAIEGAVVREAKLAAEDPMMSTFAFLSRMRAERVRLDGDREAIRQRLDRLRDQAAAAYGSLRAIETAADGFREEEARAADNAEQSRLDDFSSAAFLRARSRRTAERDRLA